ncbi:MAG: hypothetical protein M1823_001148 [Watsoniomyces obsoletus]|nr:MAG: hypothetical protein M1823_001148 [Watsoniomyces obsoletus]
MEPLRLTVLISGNGSNLQALIDATTSPTSTTTNTTTPFTTTTTTTTTSNSSPPPRLQNLLKIVRVISNRKSAYGLQRASKAGIPTTYHNLIQYRKMYNTQSPGIGIGGGETSTLSRSGIDQRGGEEDVARKHYDQDLLKIILEDNPDLIICAGWMHVLSPEFLDPLKGGNEGKKGIYILNLHPARLGEFDGVDAISRAWVEASSRLKTSIRATTGTAERVQDVQDVQQHQQHRQGGVDGNKNDGKKRRRRRRRRKVIMTTAVTVHHLTEQVDGGTPVVVEEVPIYSFQKDDGGEDDGEGDGDDGDGDGDERIEPLEEFEQRMHQVEWKVIVEATEIVAREILENRLQQQQQQQ